MPELYAASGGANRKLREVYAASGGANRKMREMYAASGGANRKIFMAGVPATLVSSYANIAKGDVSYPVNFHNNNTGDVLSFAYDGTDGRTQASAGAGMTYDLGVVIPPPTGDLLRIQGELSFASYGKLINRISIYLLRDGNSNATNYWSWSYSAGSAGQTLSIDTILTKSSNYWTGESLRLSISVGTVANGVNNCSGSLSIPWSAFTWLPTNMPIVLN